MYELWTVLTAILVIASFLGLLVAFFTRQHNFMQTCIGVGVLWIAYAIMLCVLRGGTCFHQVMHAVGAN